MSKENQLKYMDYAVHINGRPKGTREARLNATNEYMARLSANVDLTQEERSIWNNIVEYVKKFLTQLGVQFKVTDEIIEDLLRASFRNLQQMNSVPDAFQQAEQILEDKRSNLEESEEINNSVKENVIPLSQLDDFDYDYTRRVTRGVEEGSIGIRCLGERVERSRGGVLLCLALLISARNLGRYGQVRTVVSGVPRGEGQQRQKQTPSTQRNLEWDIIKWAKDEGSIAGGEDKRELPGNNPSGETTNTLDEEDRILYRTSDEI